MKTIITEEKINKLDETNSRLDTAEEKISDLEDITIKTVHIETEKK